MTQVGTNHLAADGVTLQAQNDLTTAYGQAAGALFPTAEPTELGGLTLTPGVYVAPRARASRSRAR